MQNVCGLSKREALRVFGFQVFDVRGLGLTGFTGKPIVWIPDLAMMQGFAGVTRDGNLGPESC